MATRGHWLLLVCLASWAACYRCEADIVIDLTYIGNPGNPADSTGLGSVNYGYYIGTYEVTAAQYTEFLNAVAQGDPYGLYNGAMADDGGIGSGCIIRSGTDGNYTYTTVPGAENQPVRWVSGFDAMRFANWMANGQAAGSTEDGVYDMSLGDQAVRTNFNSWAVPTLDEWYKAAYYSPMGVYYDYPNGSDNVPPEPTDETTPREMNFGDLPFWQGSVVFTSTGETTGQSPYGTYDQGGNVQEWTEAFAGHENRILRGGTVFNPASSLNAAAFGTASPPSADDGAGGFRLVFLIPEPSTVLLLLLGAPLLALMNRRRR